VWFENARPKRSEYRKFRVKTVEGSDDFAAMREVVERYFRRRIDEQKPLPDLVVVDGGKGQLAAAQDALSSAGLGDRPVVSLAKRDEEVFVPGKIESVRLPRRSPALRLLQQSRDEAHRFAVTFNRARRSARTLTSKLLEIPGVGPKRRRLLLQTFGSLEGVRQADPATIAVLPGFSLQSAQRILRALSPDEQMNPVPPTPQPPGIDEPGPESSGPGDVVPRADLMASQSNDNSQ
jgi:excinuclease ABC subunit C